MELSKNKAQILEKTPWLKECFETYFAPGQFVFDRSHLVDYKMRSDGYYVVMLFKVGESYYGADVAGSATRMERMHGSSLFEVCNDSLDFDEQSWKTVKVDPYCDGFTMKEDRE